MLDVLVKVALSVMVLTGGGGAACLAAGWDMWGAVLGAISIALSVVMVMSFVIAMIWYD